MSARLSGYKNQIVWDNFHLSRVILCYDFILFFSGHLKTVCVRIIENRISLEHMRDIFVEKYIESFVKITVAFQFFHLLLWKCNVDLCV